MRRTRLAPLPIACTQAFTFSGNARRKTRARLAGRSAAVSSAAVRASGSRPGALLPALLPLLPPRMGTLPPPWGSARQACGRESWRRRIRASNASGGAQNASSQRDSSEGGERGLLLGSTSERRRPSVREAATTACCRASWLGWVWLLRDEEEGWSAEEGTCAKQGGRGYRI